MTALTRANLGTATREYLDELGSTRFIGTGIGTGILRKSIDAAGRQLNRETEFNRVDATVGVHTATREYTLDTDWTKIYRVRMGTGYKKLDPTTPAQLDSEYLGWENQTAGTPSMYYTDGRYLGLYPRADATSMLRLRVLKTPPNLSSATSTPSWCPDEYHDTIAKIAAINLATGVLATTEGSAIRASALYQSYLRDVQEMKRLANRRSAEYTGGFKPTGYDFSRRL